MEIVIESLKCGFKVLCVLRSLSKLSGEGNVNKVKRIFTTN